MHHKPRRHAAIAGLLLAAASPVTALAQDPAPTTAEPVPADTTSPNTTPDTSPDTSSDTSSGTTPNDTATRPRRDPNAVLGGTTTFPSGQNPARVAVAPPLSEWDGVYVEASVGLLDTRESISGVTGRVGYQSKSLFGGELEYSTGLGESDAYALFGVDDDLGPVGVERRLELDSIVAGFARARFPLDDRIGIFARIGYHESTFTFNDRVFTRSEDDPNNFEFAENRQESRSFNGLATGLGAELSIRKSIGGRLEYSRYEVGDGLTVNYLSIGGQLRF